MVRPRVALIGGTWSWRGWRTAGQWYQADSPFVAFLEAAGFEVAAKDRPFVWTSRVNGLWFQKNRHLDWDAAGANLALWLDWNDHTQGVTQPVDIVIGHSHALQVIAYAAAYHGAEIPLLVSVCSPIRDDMRATVQAARAHVGYWRHIASDWTDRMQWCGELCDGGWGIRRNAIWSEHGRVVVAANESVRYPGLGHSGLLRDPQHFDLWRSQGWLLGPEA